VAVFKKQGVSWLDYYVNGRRKRERIDPDTRLAETVLRKRKVEIAEGKFLDKQRPVTTTFDELVDAYLAYARKNKRSWDHDERSIKALAQVFGGKRLAEITPASVEQYKAWRLASISRLGRHPRPATLNRELACLKRMFTVALRGLIVLKGGALTVNPAAAVSLEREHNERDRALSSEEFQCIYRVAPAWLQPMMLIAYHTGMREGEIRSLRRESVPQGWCYQRHIPRPSPHVRHQRQAGWSGRLPDHGDYRP
jgi:integrase